MGIACRVEKRGGCVVLALTGEYNKGERVSLAEESGRLVREQWTDRSKPLRLLIDVRGVTGSPSMASGHFAITKEWWADEKMRIAWLYSDARNDAHFRYRETVARQHGYFTRAFRDEDQAMRWLTEGTEWAIEAD